MIPALPPSAAGPAPAPTPASAIPAGRSFAAVLEAHTARDVPGAGARRTGVGPGLDPRPKTSPAVHLLQAVDRARARLDGVLEAARSGRTFTAQELLGLQAEAYRTVQTVDLGVKLVEQGAQAVRQALATQV